MELIHLNVKVRSLFLEDSSVEHASAEASSVFTSMKIWMRSLNQHEMAQSGKPRTGWTVSW